MGDQILGGIFHEDISGNLEDALLGASSPSAANVLATINDVSGVLIPPAASSVFSGQDIGVFPTMVVATGFAPKLVIMSMGYKTGSDNTRSIGFATALTPSANQFVTFDINVQGTTTGGSLPGFISRALLSSLASIDGILSQMDSTSVTVSFSVSGSVPDKVIDEARIIVLG